MDEQQIRSKETESLLQMVCKEWKDYQLEALTIAKDELNKRGVQYQPHIVALDVIVAKEKRAYSARVKRNLCILAVLMAAPFEAWLLLFTGLSGHIVGSAITAGVIAGITGIWAHYKPLVES
jgi:hypothetical protein